MAERSPRLRGLRPRGQQHSPQAQNTQVENSQLNEIEDNLTLNRSNEEQEKDADTSETLSDDELHIAIKDEQEDGISEDKSDTEKSYECKNCKNPVGFPTLVEYLQHLRDEHKEKGRSYDCPHCDFVCHHPKNLQEHYNEQHKDLEDVQPVEDHVPNQCTMCPYIASNDGELESHQRVHHLKRRFFRCTKCTYMTHVRSRYTKHVKYHSMPLIKCKYCDFRTPYKWNLDRHTRNHGGGGAFQCRACSFTSDLRQSLTVHETNHHEPPVGQSPRSKLNTPLDRKSRNGPKRYNQVGASDYRDTDQSESPTTPKKNRNTAKSSSPDPGGLESLEDRRNAIAGADCIALKCEEKGCQFITAWDSEMQRHLAESHAPSLSPVKQRKPLPMLIPLSPDSENSPSAKQNSSTNVSPNSTLLKVPRVRVRPELARIARDTEIAKLYGNRDSGSAKRDNINTDTFEKRNASFFDKLKERLMTTSGNIGSSTNVAVEGHTIGRRVFKCPHCQFWASTASRFHVHIVGHLNRKPFECSLCAYRSNWRWDITKHIKLKAARDPSHMNARVLMTDETGRRNYSKYNKYLAQGNDDTGLDEGPAEEAPIDEPPKKLLIMSENKDFSGPPELTPAPGLVPENSETNSMSILTALNLRPPPLLKSAGRSQGQSLLKTNPISVNAGVSILAPNAVSNATVSNVNHDDTKRTLWKCKRCNFRSPSKETVLSHVKTHYDNAEQIRNDSQSSELTCSDCPYITKDGTAMAAHRIHHRPNLEAIFKCYLCPYYVSTKKELLEHARLHGEELAVVHQKSGESIPTGSKRKLQSQSTDNAERSSKPEVVAIEVQASSPSANSSALPTTSSENDAISAPPLLLDTRALPDTPLVWVSRTDGTLAKMLKCRHCPYVSSRRAEVRDHETMHVNSPSPGPLVACPDCSFTCSRRDVMESHSEMHLGSLGTVHCLVDEGRTDAQQLEDLATLLGLARTPSLGPEPDLRDSRLVHCCSKCPARFLCEKELRIHLRYHSTELAYSCQWCSYAARQPAHLMAHQKAHSSEYQERTRYLLSMYGHSQRYAPPNTACIETTENVETSGSDTTNLQRVAWIVVELTSNNTQNFVPNPPSMDPRNGNQVFTCAKCPARYFKLDALEYHMTLHGSNNRFKCTECDYSPKTGQNLMKHQVVHGRRMETHENSQIDRNSMINGINEAQFNAQARGNPNFVYPGCLKNGRLKEKRYKCHKCPSAFEKREQYRVHQSLHGAKQRYRCPKCDYSVKYYANYAQHMKKHAANAQAQGDTRNNESETINVEEIVNDNENVDERRMKNRRKSTISSITNNPVNVDNGSVVNNGTAIIMQTSTQDKQSLILMEKKGSNVASSFDENEKLLRCQECPFSHSDKDTMDAHKRRHGIERLTPSCPHCNYVPRKDENPGEHIRLHFTRLYKPDSYIIVELLSLSMKRTSGDKKDEKRKDGDLLFRECADGKFLPINETNVVQTSGTSGVNGYQEKVIVDPNTVNRERL